MTSLLLFALAALVTGGLLLWLVDASIRRTPIGVGLILSLVVADSADVPLPNVNLGGISIYAGDMVFAMIATACVARLLRAHRLEPGHYGLIALAALTAYSLVRGVPAFGVGAVNESRSWLLPVAAMVYVATTAPVPQILDRIGRLWIWAGSALAFVALGRWASLAIGINMGPVFEPNVSGSGDIRVLGAPETLVIAQAFLLLAPSWDRDGRPRDRIWAAVLMGTVILMLHRTVWVAVFGAILALFWRRPALGRRFGMGLVIVGAVAAMSATVLLSTDSDNLESRAANTQTFSWRVEGWRQLVIEQFPDDRTTLLLGERFGSGFTRVVNGLIREESPHSTYVEALLRMGVLGLLALLAPALHASWVMAQRRRRRQVLHLLDNDALLPLTVFSLLYGVTYGPQVTTLMALGIAVNVALCSRAPISVTVEPRAAAQQSAAQPAGGAHVHL